MAEEQKETANFCRLLKVLIDLGPTVLREYLPNNLADVVKKNKAKIDKAKIDNLHSKRILFDEQYLLLTEDPPDPEKYDISLLTIILRNLCPNIPSPSNGWSKEPDSADRSLGADILRLRNSRNALFAHVPNTRVSHSEFKFIWDELKAVIERIYTSQHGSPGLKNISERIDAIESEDLDPHSTQMAMMKEALRNWQQQDDKYQAIMKELENQAKIQNETLKAVKEIRSAVVMNQKDPVATSGTDESDGATSMGTEQDTPMPSSTYISSEIDDLQDSFSSLATRDNNDDHYHLVDHFDVCILYTEDNGNKAEQIRDFINNMDGNYKPVVYDDETYFGFFTPENLPTVVCDHCILFLIIVADNLQADKFAKYLRSTVSMAKKNTALVRPVLFSKLDEELIPTSLSNTRPMPWYDANYLKTKLPEVLKQCKDLRQKREENQIKTAKDIQN